jgi:hypothetical protein
MKKINVFYSDGCLVGLKVQFGYNAADAQLLGEERKGATEKHLSLGDAEYITGVEVRTGNKCIEFLKFSTNKKQSLAVGSGSGMWVNKPQNNAYAFGFKGDGGGGCALISNNKSTKHQEWDPLNISSFSSFSSSSSSSSRPDDTGYDALASGVCPGSKGEGGGGRGDGTAAGPAGSAAAAVLTRGYLVGMHPPLHNWLASTETAEAVK